MYKGRRMREREKWPVQGLKERNVRPFVCKDGPSDDLASVAEPVNDPPSSPGTVPPSPLPQQKLRTTCPRRLFACILEISPDSTLRKISFFLQLHCTPWYAAAAAKSLQLCPALYDPINGSPPGSPVPGILQARLHGIDTLNSDREKRLLPT